MLCNGMAKNPLTHAIAQWEHHKTQAAKWEQYIALHKELYGEGDGPASSAQAERPARTSVPRTGAIAETREVAHLILEEAKGYVQSADLIAKLAEMGVEVGGANASSTLSARLSGDPDIESRRGYGYRLVKYAELEEAAGKSSPDAPAASLLPYSADKDGQEVVHDNMNH